MQAIWSFSCSLAITRSSLFIYIYIYVERLSKNPFTPALRFQNIKLEYKITWVTKKKCIKQSKARTEKPITKKSIVLRVTRVLGLPILQKRAPENMFFVFCLVFFFLLVLGFSHTCNCLLRTYSYRLTGKNLIGKVSLSHEVPFCLL